MLAEELLYEGYHYAHIAAYAEHRRMVRIEANCRFAARERRRNTR